MDDARIDVGLRVVFGEAFAVYRQRAGLLILVTILLTAPFPLINWVFEDETVIGLASFLIEFAADAWLSAILLLLVWSSVTRDSADGVKLLDAFKIPLGFFVPLLVVVTGTSIGVGLGLVLLIVPGVLLFTAWFVALPILVVEQTGIQEAWSKSRELTRKHVKDLVWVCLLLLLIGFLPLGYSLIDGFGTASSLTGFAVGTLLFPFETIAMAVVYRRLTSDRQSIGE